MKTQEFQVLLHLSYKKVTFSPPQREILWFLTDHHRSLNSLNSASDYLVIFSFILFNLTKVQRLIKNL